MADISQIKLPNGSIYDLKDEVSGYITLNDLPIDQEIPVSRIGDVEIGDTVGTESTNLPTSKAVVDYVEERLEDEIGAINVPVESVNGKTGQVVLTANDVGAASQSYVDDAIDNLWIPTSTSQLTNDSGFITSYKDEKVKQESISSNNSSYKPILLAYKSDGITSTNYVNQNIVFCYQSSTQTLSGVKKLDGDGFTITLPNVTGTVALTSDIPTIPTNISAFTNDSGYLTSSDIASVLTYKGTKTSVANLPSTGNKTGDVWHITADGSEYAWDGSIWQELGTAIDLSGYVSITGSIMSPSQYTSNQYMRDIFLGESMDGSQDSSGVEINPDKIRFRVRNFSTSASGDIYFTPQMALSNTPILKLEGKYTSSSSVSSNNVIIRGVNTPTNNTDAANKKYVDDSIGALSIPTKTSDLTNDSGFITSYTDEKLKTGLISTNTMYYIILDTGSTTATTKYRSNTLSVQQLQNTITVQIGKPSSSVSTKGELALSSNRNALVTIGTNATDNRIITLPDASGTIALTSDIPDTSSFLTSETDPVFSASAAAGITSTDISNWNAKISDDKTWNGVILDKVGITNSGVNYVPARSAIDATTAYQLKATYTPEALKIAKWDNGPYLHSTTPSANDNSTKVATTAYVDAAIPDVSGFSTTDEKLKINVVSNTDVYYPIFGSNSTNVASTQLYDSNFKYQSATKATLTLGSYNGKTGSLQIFKDSYYIALQPDTLTSAKTIYLPDKAGTIALTSDIPSVYSSTNTGGYLTMATLPIYDGTVV